MRKKKDIDEYEELHGRKKECTCDEDPDYCEKHNDFI